MNSKKSAIKRLLGAVALSGCVLTNFSSLTLAQSNSGFTLWGNVPRENLLDYHLDFGGRSDQWDRYRLKIPASKMDLGVAQFAISYPDYFDGKFDPKKVEVRVKGKEVKLSEVKWDKEGRLIQIDLEEPITAGNSVELILSNVKNPPFGGIYYFNCQALSPGDIPLPRYLGTWVLSIGGM
jgi:hypothetical protein